MRLPREFASDVRNQGDIVRVVSDYITLKKRGANYLACCPFHSDKTPSFNVHPGKRIFKCFGCGAGGGIFDFVMRIEGCGFPEAVRIVAEKSGIPFPVVDETEDHKKSDRKREGILRLNQWAAEFFEFHLNESAAGNQAREYIRSRGIGEETAKLFRLGYAPDSWHALTDYLKERGATLDEIHDSGLAVMKDTGGFYDRFRARVIFPISDSQGRVIAFGARVMGEGEQKYLNSPETALYVKGRNLYGLSHASGAIRRLGFAILVEGYCDCITPFQGGIQNVVACLGTALTESQARLLRRYMGEPRIVVCFDPDAPGQAATLKSTGVLLVEGFEVKVLRMSNKQDPDEFVRVHGAERFRELLKTKRPYLDYIIDTSIVEHDTSSPTGKVAAVNAILPHLARMRDLVARSVYADRIAERLKIDAGAIREELKRAALRGHCVLDETRVLVVEEITVAERQLLEIVLNNDDVRRALLFNLTDEDYSDLATGAIFASLVQIERAGWFADFDSISERIESESQRDLLATLMISDRWSPDDGFETLFGAAADALTCLRSERIERAASALQAQIVEAERENDDERVLFLCQQKMELQGGSGPEIRKPSA